MRTFEYFFPFFHSVLSVSEKTDVREIGIIVTLLKDSVIGIKI